LHDWKDEIRRAFAPRALDAEVVEELAQHAEASHAARRADGLDEAAAREHVCGEIRVWLAEAAALGHRPRRPPSVTPPPTSRSADAWLKDLQYATRLIARQPGHSALVVATMALGITAAIVLASVAYSVLLKPLPWADAPRLVRLYETREGSTRRLNPMMTNGSYLAWQTPSPDTLDALGAWSQVRLTMTNLGDPLQLHGVSVTPGLLEMLGAAPLMGRPFAAGEEQPGRPRIVLISHGFWQQQMGARPDVIGQSLRLDGQPHEVVGVMPPQFAFPTRETQVWVPFYVRPTTVPGTPGTSLSLFQALGRLREGATPAEAAAEGTARGRAAAPAGPVAMAVFGSTGPVQISAVPMLDALVADVRAPIVLMTIAVALLLVTATANVASLQLARSVSRRREFAVRAALGAGRPRLLRQMMIENLALGLLSGLAALALAAAIHRVLPAVLPADFPRLDDIGFDVRVQLLGVLMAITTAVAFGLLPARQASRGDLVSSLAEDALAPVGGSMRSPVARTRAAIMATQVAVACVLLVGALLLIRSFIRLTEVPIGFDATNLVTARVVRPVGYPPERLAREMEDVLARLSRSPAVDSAAFTTSLPFTTGVALSSFPLKKRDGSDVQVQTGMQVVSAGFFAALRQRVLEGREFTPSDLATSQPVVLVNREFSRRYLDDRALGWTLPASEGKTPPEIIGIVEDMARQSVTDTPQPEVYYPVSQRPLQSHPTLIVRGASDPRALIAMVQTSVREAAPDAPIESIRTMEDLVSATLARPRLYGLLLGTFATFALLIAGVGLFSVLSYSVAQRAREIAVRSALGAEARDIVALIARQTAGIVAAGLFVGLMTSLWASSLLDSLVYGITTRDAPTFAAVAGLLMLVALAASVVPARRAAHVDPVRVLRGS
jgi:predicted permease